LHDCPIVDNVSMRSWWRFKSSFVPTCMLIKRNNGVSSKDDQARLTSLRETKVGRSARSMIMARISEGISGAMIERTVGTSTLKVKKCVAASRGYCFTTHTAYNATYDITTKRVLRRTKFEDLSILEMSIVEGSCSFQPPDALQASAFTAPAQRSICSPALTPPPVYHAGPKSTPLAQR
jgi:hypothetical protein